MQTSPGAYLGRKVGPELLGQENLRGGRVELEGLPGAEQVEEGRADRNSTSFLKPSSRNRRTRVFVLYLRILHVKKS